MNEEIRISYVIPLYNCANYIRRCIQSVEGQSNDGYEIIVVNDSSTDNSAEIVAEMAKENPRIKLLHKENAGPGPARNLGIEAACGKYIYFMDADDVLFPGTMMPQLDIMDQKDLEALHVEFVKVDPDGVEEALLNAPKSVRPKCSEVITGVQYLKDTEFLMYKLTANTVWQIIFRLDVIRNNNIRNISGRSEDVLFHIEYMTNVQRMAWSDVCTYVYVRYMNSTCHRRYLYDHSFQITYSFLEDLKRIRSKYHDVYATNGLLQYIDLLGYGECFVHLIWLMIRDCVSPSVCRRDLAKLRKLGIYPLIKLPEQQYIGMRGNKMLIKLWKLSRHYYLWMALITVNHLLRKAPAVEADRVGR